MKTTKFFGTLALLSSVFVAAHTGAAEGNSANRTAPSAAAIDAKLINPGQLKWEKTIPALGKNSPEYAILHSDPKTNLTTLMFRTPIPVHIKAHTHDAAETHVVLVGGTHVFEAGGTRYNIENGGYLRMPGGVTHEAWLPAGSQTLNILESGWVVNWINGGPSAEDANKYPPVPSK